MYTIPFFPALDTCLVAASRLDFCTISATEAVVRSHLRQIPTGHMQEYFEPALRHHDHGPHHFGDTVGS